MSKITKTIAALGVVDGIGFAALPLASYAATTAPVTVSASLNESMSIEVDDPDLSFTLTNGQASTAQTTTATVITNHSGGYTVTIKPTGGQTNLSNTEGDTIPTGTTMDGSVSAWGYNLDAGDTYTAFTAAGAVISSSEDPTTTTGAKVPVTVNVAASSAQEAGTYTGGFDLIVAGQ